MKILTPPQDLSYFLKKVGYRLVLFGFFILIFVLSVSLIKPLFEEYIDDDLIPVFISQFLLQVVVGLTILVYSKKIK